MSKTNHVRLIGNLGADPTLITSTNGNNVLTFTIATHETFKDEHGNTSKRTEWHSCVAFGKIATLVHTHLRKGSHCMLIGRLQTRQYVDKQQQQRYTTEIISEEVLFLGEPKHAQSSDIDAK
jgi:single-strand DNA-binding protein